MFELNLFCMRRVVSVSARSCIFVYLSFLWQRVNECTIMLLLEVFGSFFHVFLSPNAQACYIPIV